MKLIPTTQHNPRKENELERVRKALRVARGAVGVGQNIIHGHGDEALLQAVTLGVKLAADKLFYEPQAPVIELLRLLKTLGDDVLMKSPETLFALIDKRFGGKTDQEAGEDIEHFHKTGLLRTKVPLLVRNKIYAIRTAATSDAPYEEWNIFEKVGGAFNGRVSNFSVVEPMSAGECAVTVALLDVIRQDRFSNEVKTYIAACCHEDGLLTVKPLEYLAIAEDQLHNFNKEVTGDTGDGRQDKAMITDYFNKMKDSDPEAPAESEEPEYRYFIQAQHLFGAYLMVQEALRGSY